MMKILSQIFHNSHKRKLTTTRFNCFINGEIKNKPKKPSNGNSAFFSAATANSAAKGEFRVVA